MIHSLTDKYCVKFWRIKPCELLPYSNSAISVGDKLPSLKSQRPTMLQGLLQNSCTLTQSVGVIASFSALFHFPRLTTALHFAALRIDSVCRSHSIILSIILLPPTNLWPCKLQRRGVPVVELVGCGIVNYS